MGHPAVGHAHLVDHGPGWPGRAAARASTASVIDGGGRPGSARASSWAYSGWPPAADTTVGSGPPGAGRQQAGDQFGDLRVGQARQPQPGHAGAAFQLGQPAPGATVQVFLAQRRSHQHPGLAQPDGQEREQFPGRLVGPVHVFQHQHHRGVGGQRTEQVQHAHEQPVPRGQHVARAAVVEQPAGLLAEGGGERPVGQGGPASGADSP